MSVCCPSCPAMVIFLWIPCTCFSTLLVMWMMFCCSYKIPCLFGRQIFLWIFGVIVIILNPSFPSLLLVSCCTAVAFWHWCYVQPACSEFWLPVLSGLSCPDVGVIRPVLSSLLSWHYFFLVSVLSNLIELSRLLKLALKTLQSDYYFSDTSFHDSLFTFVPSKRSSAIRPWFCNSAELLKKMYTSPQPILESTYFRQTMYLLIIYRFLLNGTIAASLFPLLDDWLSAISYLQREPHGNG
jgi:hypothetical protein